MTCPFWDFGTLFSWRGCLSGGSRLRNLWIVASLLKKLTIRAYPRKPAAKDSFPSPSHPSLCIYVFNPCISASIRGQIPARTTSTRTVSTEQRLARAAITLWMGSWTITNARYSIGLIFMDWILRWLRKREASAISELLKFK